MLQSHKKLIQLLEFNLVIKSMRNKLNYNLVRKLQLKPLRCSCTLLQKLLDDCTFSTFSTFSFDHFSSIEKVIKLTTLLAVGTFLFRVDDCTF